MPESTPSKPRGRHRWPLILTGALVGHAAATLGAVAIAVSDSSFAVVPDYYQKAVHWDDRRADERRSADLGWSLSVTPGSLVDGQGRRVLRCELTDARGEPISDATVSLRLFHHAHARDVRTVALTPRGPGSYQALAPMGSAGVWSVDAEAATPAARFVRTLEVVVEAATETPR